MNTDSSTTSWNLIAADWANFAETNDYRTHFLIPHTLRLLGPVDGKSILDLGCGEGGYARILSKKGAAVTAIDGSEKLIEIAQEKAGQEGLSITHLVRNANALDGIKAQSFDIVLASMSLMDVEDYRGALVENRRILRKGGKLLMSILHPCFSERATDNYFDKTPWKEFVAKDFRQKVLFRHMPLQDFINPLLDLGFKMQGFYEPMPTQEQMQASSRIPRLAKVPMFLFMEWTKG